MELLPFGKYSSSTQRTPRIFILLVLAVIVLGLIPSYHPFNWYPAGLITTPAEISPTTYYSEDQKIKVKEPETCDIFKGEWVWNPDGPYYTNNTCYVIQEHQNCMNYGRPDTDYLKWRWQPNGCELPIFNPFQFLDMVRNKPLALVVDSVGRNQMQSLMSLGPVFASRLTEDYDRQLISLIIAMRFSSFQKELRPAGTMSSSSSLVLCCTSRMFASTSSVRAGSMCFKTCFGAFTCSTLKKLGLSELQYRNVTTVLTRDLDSRPDEWFNYAAKRISHLYLLCLYIEEQTNVIIGLFVKDLSV